MMYTDAIDEDNKAAPEDVEKELCNDCYDKVWELGEVTKPTTGEGFLYMWN
jgi:hypothetical protein